MHHCASTERFKLVAVKKTFYVCIGHFRYHMPDIVYWLAADPYDLRPGQWRVDLIKYQWVCQANARLLPEDDAGKEQFKADFLTVTNVEQCNSVVQQWMRREMMNPETRTPIVRIGWK